MKTLSNGKRLLAVEVSVLLAVGACASLAEAAGEAELAPRVPRVLLVEGLWTDVFRLREACHAAGVAYEGAYKSRSAYFGPNDRLIGMPDAFERFDAIVLCNVDANTLGATRLESIRRFVEEGGGLVVLGGYWAYSRGAYGGTPLETLLPVDMPPENRIAPAWAGLLLAPQPGAPWTASLDFSDGPRAFFVQTLSPKAGAAVWLTAGDKPAVIAGGYGKGRVAAVALTVNGDAPEGVTAFWDWPAWTPLLGAMVDWAATGPRPVRAAITTTALTRAELVELTMGEATEALIRRALAAPTPEAADALFEHALSSSTGHKVGLAEFGRVLIPFAKPSWAVRLVEQAGFSNPDLPGRRSALALLGATRAPESLPALIRALQDKDTRNAAIEGLGLFGDAAEIPRLRHLFEDTMREARGGTTDGPVLPDFFGQGLAATAAEAALALYRLGDETGVERLIDVYRHVHLYHRIFRNAGKRRVLEGDPTGIEIRRKILERAGILGTVLDRLRRTAGPVPPSQAEAFVRRAMTETEPVAVEWLFTALDRDEPGLPDSAWAGLAKAKDGILARFARAVRAN